MPRASSRSVYPTSSKSKIKSTDRKRTNAKSANAKSKNAKSKNANSSSPSRKALTPYRRSHAGHYSPHSLRSLHALHSPRFRTSPQYRRSPLPATSRPLHTTSRKSRTSNRNYGNRQCPSPLTKLVINVPRGAWWYNGAPRSPPSGTGASGAGASATGTSVTGASGTALASAASAPSVPVHTVAQVTETLQNADAADIKEIMTANTPSLPETKLATVNVLNDLITNVAQTFKLKFAINNDANSTRTDVFDLIRTTLENPPTGTTQDGMQDGMQGGTHERIQERMQERMQGGTHERMQERMQGGRISGGKKTGEEAQKLVENLTAVLRNWGTQGFGLTLQQTSQLVQLCSITNIYTDAAGAKIAVGEAINKAWLEGDQQSHFIWNTMAQNQREIGEALRATETNKALIADHNVAIANAQKELDTCKQDITKIRSNLLGTRQRIRTKAQSMIEDVQSQILQISNNDNNNAAGTSAGAGAGTGTGTSASTSTGTSADKIQSLNEEIELIIKAATSALERAKDQAMEDESGEKEKTDNLLDKINALESASTLAGVRAAVHQVKTCIETCKDCDAKIKDLAVQLETQTSSSKEALVTLKYEHDTAMAACNSEKETLTKQVTRTNKALENCQEQHNKNEVPRRLKEAIQQAEEATDANNIAEAALAACKEENKQVTEKLALCKVKKAAAVVQNTSNTERIKELEQELAKVNAFAKGANGAKADKDANNTSEPAISLLQYLQSPEFGSLKFDKDERVWVGSSNNIVTLEEMFKTIKALNNDNLVMGKHAKAANAAASEWEQKYKKVVEAATDQKQAKQEKQVGVKLEQPTHDELLTLVGNRQRAAAEVKQLRIENAKLKDNVKAAEADAQESNKVANALRIQFSWRIKETKACVAKYAAVAKAAAGQTEGAKLGAQQAAQEAAQEKAHEKLLELVGQQHEAVAKLTECTANLDKCKSKKLATQTQETQKLTEENKQLTASNERLQGANKQLTEQNRQHEATLAAIKYEKAAAEVALAAATTETAKNAAQVSALSAAKTASEQATKKAEETLAVLSQEKSNMETTKKGLDETRRLSKAAAAEAKSATAGAEEAKEEAEKAKTEAAQKLEALKTANQAAEQVNKTCAENLEKHTRNAQALVKAFVDAAHTFEPQDDDALGKQAVKQATEQIEKDAYKALIEIVKKLYSRINTLKTCCEEKDTAEGKLAAYRAGKVAEQEQAHQAKLGELSAKRTQLEELEQRAKAAAEAARAAETQANTANEEAKASEAVLKTKTDEANTKHETQMQELEAKQAASKEAIALLESEKTQAHEAKQQSEEAKRQADAAQNAAYAKEAAANEAAAQAKQESDRLEKERAKRAEENAKCASELTTCTRSAAQLVARFAKVAEAAGAKAAGATSAATSAEDAQEAAHIALMQTVTTLVEEIKTLKECCEREQVSATIATMLAQLAFGKKFTLDMTSADTVIEGINTTLKLKLTYDHTDGAWKDAESQSVNFFDAGFNEQQKYTSLLKALNLHATDSQALQNGISKILTSVGLSDAVQALQKAAGAKPATNLATDLATDLATFVEKLDTDLKEARSKLRKLTSFVTGKPDIEESAWTGIFPQGATFDEQGGTWKRKSEARAKDLVPLSTQLKAAQEKLDKVEYALDSLDDDDDDDDNTVTVANIVSELVKMRTALTGENKSLTDDEWSRIMPSAAYDPDLSQWSLNKTNQKVQARTQNEVHPSVLNLLKQKIMYINDLRRTLQVAVHGFVFAAVAAGAKSATVTTSTNTDTKNVDMSALPNLEELGADQPQKVVIAFAVNSAVASAGGAVKAGPQVKAANAKPTQQVSFTLERTKSANSFWKVKATSSSGRTNEKLDASILEAVTATVVGRTAEMTQFNAESDGVAAVEAKIQEQSTELKAVQSRLTALQGALNCDLSGTDLSNTDAACAAKATKGQELLNLLSVNMKSATIQQIGQPASARNGGAGGAKQPPAVDPHVNRINELVALEKTAAELINGSTAQPLPQPNTLTDKLSAAFKDRDNKILQLDVEKRELDKCKAELAKLQAVNSEQQTKHNVDITEARWESGTFQVALLRLRNALQCTAFDPTKFNINNDTDRCTIQALEGQKLLGTLSNSLPKRRSRIEPDARIRQLLDIEIAANNIVDTAGVQGPRALNMAFQERNNKIEQLSQALNAAAAGLVYAGIATGTLKTGVRGNTASQQTLQQIKDSLGRGETTTISLQDGGGFSIKSAAHKTGQNAAQELVVTVLEEPAQNRSHQVPPLSHWITELWQKTELMIAYQTKQNTAQTVQTVTEKNVKLVEQVKDLLLQQQLCKDKTPVYDAAVEMIKANKAETSTFFLQKFVKAANSLMTAKTREDTQTVEENQGASAQKTMNIMGVSTVADWLLLMASRGAFVTASLSLIRNKQKDDTLASVQSALLHHVTIDEKHKHVSAFWSQTAETQASLQWEQTLNSNTKLLERNAEMNKQVKDTLRKTTNAH